MATPEELVDETYRLMRKLSELSAKAKAAGEDSLMYAANRAWREMHDYQRIVERPAVTNGERA